MYNITPAAEANATSNVTIFTINDYKRSKWYKIITKWTHHTPRTHLCFSMSTQNGRAAPARQLADIVVARPEAKVRPQQRNVAFSPGVRADSEERCCNTRDQNACSLRLLRACRATVAWIHRKLSLLSISERFTSVTLPWPTFAGALWWRKKI